ncbi:hypothetical protein NDU88_005098 [Pleurodeles waltl]|uniref:Uncharacterized protein n=1 Tax=Pleurodeles waltl TaxID=8319 RepID=A0AAV7VMA8_PLEWA|nr:hypothetical protein NDU88_005098 [Pleurodeles waltl]
MSGPGFRLRSSDLSMCSLITPAFRCTGPLLQPPDNSSPLGALRLHRRDGGELLRCPLGSNDQTLDHSPGLPGSQSPPRAGLRVHPGPLASRGAAPPHPFRCGSSWALRPLQHLCRYEEGTPYYPPSRLALPAPTAGWCRRLPLEPPASGHAGRSAPPPDTLKGRCRGRSLSPGSAPVCSRGRPRSATPSCNAPTGRDFSRGHGRPLLSHRLIRPRPGPRTFTSRRLLPSPAGPATAQREAADAVVRPGLSSPEPSRRPISAPGSLRRHQRGTLSPSPLL